MDQTKIKIIGIAGTNGSGKDTVGQTLAEQHNFLFVSVTDLLRTELKHRNVAIDRENLRTLSAEWRRQYGLAVLVDRAMDEFRRADGDFAGLAISSLRNPYEADRVHELGGIVLWIDADPKTRYRRIQNNAANRARSGEDNTTYDQFLAQEAAEMHSSGDAATLDMAAVKRRSDMVLINDNTNLEQFKDFITQQLFGQSNAA